MELKRVLFQIADAPAVAVNRVDTYKELDNDLLKHVAYATLDDIDLRLLTRCMAPEQALKEPGENPCASCATIATKLLIQVHLRLRSK